MNHTLLRNLFLTVAGLLAAQAAAAAETGFYVGGFYGTADKDDGIGIYNSFTSFVQQQFGYVPLAQQTPTLDTKTQSYGFVGGYRLFQHFAIEGGYMQLGSVKYRFRGNGVYPPPAQDPTLPLNPALPTTDTPTDLLVNVDNEIGGIAVSALGILPISYRWELYGRAGVMFSTHNFKYYINDVVGPLKDQFSESSTDLLAGVGASFMLAEVYTIRAEFIRVFDAGNKDNGQADVDVLNVGVTVKF
jgi:hypothetical protein